MRRYNGNQTDLNEILDDYCHITSVLIASTLKVMLLHKLKILI